MSTKTTPKAEKSESFEIEQGAESASLPQDNATPAAAPKTPFGWNKPNKEK